MKTLIVGGGLSGLALAEMLEAEGYEYTLIEARQRFGGRIMTQQIDGASFDMGPAWFWPGQPRLAALTERFALSKFDQFSKGALIYEDAQGQVQRNQGFSSMEGSWRLAGGWTALTDALANSLPGHRTQFGTPVKKLEMSAAGCCATLQSGVQIEADQIVLALPPRIGAGLEFHPALPDPAIQAMQSIPTWMAGQAKALAIYDAAFWRDQGLSGDAMSRAGPMVEIHDASPAQGGPFALFGFIGVPAQGRTDEHRLRQAVQAQLARLFGPQAAKPRQLLIKDWALDPYTSTEADLAPVYAHPNYGLAQTMTNLWGGKLYFAGTEVAPTFGGYIEGALEAAEAVLQSLKALGQA